MKTSVITNVTDLDSVAAALSRLDQYADLSTQTADWVRSAARLYNRNQLRFVIVWDGVEIAAIATLAVARVRFVNRWIIAGSNHFFEPCGLVYRDDEALAALTHKLTEVREPLLLSRIPADQTWISNIDEHFGRHAYVAIRPAHSCPVIRLHSGWQDPLSQLSSRRRSDLRRAYRRADQFGQVETIIVVPSLEEVDSLIERAMLVEAASWKGRTGSALLTTKLRGKFFRTFARTASAGGSLRIGMLRIDGKDAAMQIAVVFRGSWWIYKIGYDEQYARCSPGTILICETIGHAAANQLERFEFMGKSEDWLSMWTREHRELITIRTYPLSPRGAGAFIVDAISKMATLVRSIFQKIRSK